LSGVRHFVRIKEAETNPKGKTVNTKYLNLVSRENFHAKPKKVMICANINNFMVVAAL